MYLFSHVYQECVDMVRKRPLRLHSDWAGIEKGLRELLQRGGPAPDKAGVLDELRRKLSDAAKTPGSDGQAQEILRASQPAIKGFQERAALIKQMRHFYLAGSRGDQCVWLVDNPRDYFEWCFPLFREKSPHDVLTELRDDEEVYGPADRMMLFDALQLARKWSADAQIKLDADSAEVDAKIRRWFLPDDANDANDAALAHARRKLQGGFRDITAACNSNQVFFSDAPYERAEKELAWVNELDKLLVIYTPWNFLRANKISAWERPLAIIHELSHRVLKTGDAARAEQGLKPNKGFPMAMTLTNADSWAYFCADLAGAVPVHMVDDILR